MGWTRAGSCKREENFQVGTIGGMGLGVRKVKKVFGDHGGSLWLEHEVSVGPNTG